MMEITTYERCDTMASGLPEDYLVGLTKPSVDRILKMDNPGDCLALYTFYCYTRKWQKNSAVFATSEYAMTGLGWGRDRFSHAKKQLKEAGFIDDVSRKGEDGRVLKWYVEVRFAQSATLANFHTTENLHCGKTPDKYLGMVNEIPSNDNQIQKENSAVASHSSTQPNLFQTSSHEGHISGSAAAELKSADGKKKTPHCAAPPRPTKSKSIQIEKPIAVSEQVWDDFIALRKAKRAPLSQTALAGILSEADKALMTLEDALTECITRGWQGFKAEWMKPKTTTKPERFSNI
jgi:hypothetical protein